MGRVQKLFESFFGEAKKVSEIDSKLMSDLKKEMKEYVKDWPTDAFNIDFQIKIKDGEDTAEISSEDIEAFEILNVKDFVNLIADSLNVEIDEKEITEKVVEDLFSFLKNYTGEVEKQTRTVQWWKVTFTYTSHKGEKETETDQWEDKEKVSYKFKIKSFTYKKNEDRIDIDDVEITDLEV